VFREVALFCILLRLPLSSFISSFGFFADAYFLLRVKGENNILREKMQFFCELTDIIQIRLLGAEKHRF